MYSILTIQLLVVCLTLVRWPTTVSAKALTSGEKVKPHGKKEKTYGKKKNLTAKRKKTHGKKNNLIVRRKEKDSRQRKNLTAKRKPHGKKKKDSRQNFFDTERTLIFNSYFFCREVVVILFAVRLILLPSWATQCTFEILFPKILDFSTCGYS